MIQNTILKVHLRSFKSTRQSDEHLMVLEYIVGCRPMILMKPTLSQMEFQDYQGDRVLGRPTLRVTEV